MDDYKLHIVEKLVDEAGTEGIDESAISIPPDPKMGDYAFPCFMLAKKLKKAPPEIAEWLAGKIKPDELISSVKNLGPYVNFFIKPEVIAKNTLEDINSEKENYGSDNIGNGKSILVDYSAPNVAKNMGIHNPEIFGNGMFKIQYSKKDTGPGGREKDLFYHRIESVELDLFRATSEDARQNLEESARLFNLVMEESR